MPGGRSVPGRGIGSPRIYENALILSYQLGGNHDFGAASDSTFYAQPPGGFIEGQVFDIQVSTTEVFNGDTSNAFVRVGISGDADKYAELDMGSAADDAVYGYYDVNIFPDGQTGRINMSSDGTAGVAIAQIEISYIGAVGTPTGQGWVTVTIGWW